MPSDPTQASAIEEARAGTSYIIQGPPGTGKSQTITNLIADYVARGKRVLFVCEKRAAIDVVYARLRQCGLGDLCCLIHDSQTDKKGFVMDLKQTYEGLLAAADLPSAPAAGRPRRTRGRTCSTGSRTSFGRWSNSTRRCRARRSTWASRLRQLLRRGIELRGELGELPELSPLERERLPDYATWWRHRERIAALAAIVADIRRDGILAKHPLRRLSPHLAQVDRPLELITGAFQAAEEHFEAVEASLGRCGVPREQWQTLATARLLVDYAKQVLPVARIGRMDLLDPAGQAARQFAKAGTAVPSPAGSPGRGPRKRPAAWRQKLPAAEVPVAIEQAKAFEQGLFAWLRPAWWRLRRILNRLVRLPLARGSPPLVTGARRTPEGIRGTG